MSEIRSILQQLRTRRRKHERDLIQITEAQMARPTNFTWETMMNGGAGKTTGAAVRDIFLRRPDHLQEHAIQIEGLLRNELGITRTATDLIWAANQSIRGDLHTALAGLSDDDLDDRTGLPDDEWSLRQILEHLIVVERYYTLDAQHALAKHHAGEPHGDLPSDELQSERPGASLEDLIHELEEVRDNAISELGCLSNDELRARSRWSDIDIDVRFLLMRFGHHEREHTDQIRKWSVWRGQPQSETARLIGLCWAQHGALEGSLIGAPDDILDQEPANGDWPIRRILDHIGSAETYFRRVIVRAVE